EVLKEEWEKQVAAQTKPLPRRSKNMAKKAIEVVIGTCFCHLFCQLDLLGLTEKKLGSHTQSAIKKREPSISKLYKDYNKACAEIAKLIKRKAAPQSAIAPEPIDEKKV
ncbi:hypothetical protein B0H19DRAFT_964166, partial [Mycena capillaripes]